MTRFACAAALPGQPLPPVVAGGLAASIAVPGHDAVSLAAPGFAAATSTGPGALRPLLARRGPLLAAGDVRLDDAAEVACWAGVRAEGASELELVLALYAARGASWLGRISGDFAVVIWDGDLHAAVAARDPFGVKPLYLARRGDALLFSSRADALAREGELDEAWIADFLVGAVVPRDRTVWAGVHPVEPGTIVTWRDGSLSARRFWSAADFAPAPADERAATEAFWVMLEEAVRVRLGGVAPVWSQLSGGLDSSSIVCIAQTLARAGRGPGVAVTVTLVETMGDGDERRYSDVVVQRFGLRSEQVIDPWAWQDDGAEPDRTDEPRAHYPFWARDRAMVSLVRRGGGRVLLSGQGSDHYLTGNLGYVTDLLAAGHLRSGMRQLVRHAVATRQSFWSGLARHGIDPFLPASLLLRRARPEERLPAWLDPAFAARLRVSERLPLVRHLSERGRGGSVFARQVVAEVEGLSGMLERGAFQEGVEMRYPFLHRPLVEHALRLPPEMRIRPYGGKHVLREAMRGILPEEIRTRRGKGGIDARVLWALGRERPRLDALLRDPEIARRGWVRADALRAATDRARQGEVASLPFLLCSLSLETWLAVRAGRWESLAERAPVAA